MGIGFDPAGYIRDFSKEHLPGYGKEKKSNTWVWIGAIAATTIVVLGSGGRL